MLTFDPDRLDLRPGQRAIDVGCGLGRHAGYLYSQGLHVEALDQDEEALAATRAHLREIEEMFGTAVGTATVRHGDAYALPYPDASFDLVVASEVLEHLVDDRTAMAELLRICKPGGQLVVTVPRFGPELVCWMLSRAYHEVPGGHVRIYRRSQLRERLTDVGAELVASHHNHGLHAPYWWLRCLFGVDRDEAIVPRLYHRMLVWDLLERPWVTRATERALNPVLGKSVVLYLRRPQAGPLPQEVRRAS